MKKKKKYLKLMIKNCHLYKRNILFDIFWRIGIVNCEHNENILILLWNIWMLADRHCDCEVQCIWLVQKKWQISCCDIFLWINAFSKYVFRHISLLFCTFFLLKLLHNYMHFFIYILMNVIWHWREDTWH